MNVTEIWRYPVKSMGGQQLQQATVSDLGIQYDRRWGVFNPATGLVLTGRREPRLLLARAEVLEHADGPELRIITEKGSIIGGNLDAMSGALTGWLGYRVQLMAAGDEGGTYETPADIDNDDSWLRWQGPAGAWHDSTRTRVSLLSAATAGDIDVRRFRINVITDGAASAEDAWAQRPTEVTIGSVRLQVMKQIDRCVMVARAQGSLPADLSALKHVIATRNNLMGIGALVDAAGEFSVGDAVRAVSSSEPSS